MKTIRHEIPLLKIDKGISAPIYIEDRILATLKALKPISEIKSSKDIESFEVASKNLPALKKCMSRFHVRTFLISPPEALVKSLKVKKVRVWRMIV